MRPSICHGQGMLCLRHSKGKVLSVLHGLRLDVTETLADVTFVDAMGTLDVHWTVVNLLPVHDDTAVSAIVAEG